jgi:hypothetical protein
MTVIGIDPGPVQSAYVIWDGEKAQPFELLENGDLLRVVDGAVRGYVDEMVIEKVACYGMPVGDSVFETVFWSGRFAQAWHKEAHRIPRKDVKMHLCQNMRAKDGNIIQALKDRFEPELLPRQRPKGILKGISKDVWQALAVAVTWYDKNLTNETL